MSSQDTKQAIIDSLQAFSAGNLTENALHLFDSIGYTSEKRPAEFSGAPSDFVNDYDSTGILNSSKAVLDQWQSIYLLFQLTSDEIKTGSQLMLDFGTEKKVNNTIIESYLFFTIELTAGYYTRTQLASITREINKLFPMPVMILFRHEDTLTLSIINRRLHKRHESKDVLEKVTLIKDIAFAAPHRAHIEILFDLSLDELYHQHGFTNFVELHQAWQKVLDSSELNKRFFSEIANWYFWATQYVTFPKDAGKVKEVRNATSVIRLITRLIFIWFIKEKQLVPDDLFDQRKLKQILNYSDANGSTYYKAILQNLFFATLNQEINTPNKPDNRKFRSRNKLAGGRDPHFNIANLYRYEDYFQNPSEALDLFSQIPFLNGGLFECLDKPDKDDPSKILRIDGFSDRDDNELYVPDFLFFSEEREVDLDEEYGTKNKRYKVQGLIDILNRYKFTIEENTPIEEEIALDPELLGKVFENLLANYNPETKTTARKQTGSYYTPREIVNYMVDESLIAYLGTCLKEKVPSLAEMEELPELLREVFAYTEKIHPFNEDEVTALIDAIYNIKVLDPACGSAAFPMGILHKLVFILGKLDPQNELWKNKQLAKAAEISDITIRENLITDIEESFERNELDYGRKLYLIENCIYGVDIQSIAVQIAKLRFFISLIVDQKLDDSRENRGILPLPNLETKFVAANSLIGLDRSKQLVLHNPAIDQKEKEVENVRQRHFAARTQRTKQRCREEDARLRTEISVLLKNDGFPRATIDKLAGWDPYDQNISAEFFDAEWMFGIVDGFDVVIGNPPYITLALGRQRNVLDEDQVKQYRELYPNLVEYKGNTFSMFIGLGAKILSRGGSLSLIIPNTLLLANTMKRLRLFILNHFSIEELVNIRDRVFEGVEIGGNLVFRFSLTQPIEHHSCAVVDLGDLEELKTAKRQHVHQELFEKFSDYRFGIDPSNSGLMQRMTTNVKSLGNIAGFYNGIKTGDNKRFLSDKKINAKYKEVIRGRDVHRYFIEYGNGFVYFDPEQLWSNTNETKLRKKPKIVVRQTGDSIVAALDEQGCLTLDTTHLIFDTEINIKAQLAILNSRLLNWYHSRLVEEVGRVFAEVKIVNLKKLPVSLAAFDTKNQQRLVESVNKILSAKQADPDADISATETEIDRLVYDLYGLTEKEIKIVEGK